MSIQSFPICSAAADQVKAGKARCPQRGTAATKTPREKSRRDEKDAEKESRFVFFAPFASLRLIGFSKNLRRTRRSWEIALHRAASLDPTFGSLSTASPTSSLRIKAFIDCVANPTIHVVPESKPRSLAVRAVKFHAQEKWQRPLNSLAP
jgi:hypothetical protein